VWDSDARMNKKNRSAPVIILGITGRAAQSRHKSFTLRPERKYISCSEQREHDGQQIEEVHSFTPFFCEQRYTLL
jgi:hypothetical protein